MSTLRSTLDFLLHQWLQVECLSERSRFEDHSRETFDAVLDTCERIARDKYAPVNRLIDTEEPRFDGERVILPQVTHEAYAAFVESGMLLAGHDNEVGGMQLPHTVQVAANTLFSSASISLGACGLLTQGNANLLMAHGTARQKTAFALPELTGRFTGTMCLSEPQAGSSISDISTRATPDGEEFDSDLLGARYRLRGNKMWITGGDHELGENIVHLVLAKIPGPDGKLVPGTRGISLFIVPKKMVDGDGQLTGERNDVALAGLNHKLGWRGVTNTLLNFGEGKYPVRGKAGAIGYLIGRPGDGLRCMFHMMNEARIDIGLSATALGLAGYYASLDYAKLRTQGRPVGPAGKDPALPQVRLIEHADIKRMLLAQKAYCEGALALLLYCARLVDEQHTGGAESVEESRLLLEVLTPIAKSWPSEFCLEANSLAIQVHGGYGYTRDFSVEQYWRENRLNMIHEGSHGIQAADLLGRKVVMEGGKGLDVLAVRIERTLTQADGREELVADAELVRQALHEVVAAARAAWSTGDPAQALANAVPFMEAFGHVVLAWTWIDVLLAISAEDLSPAAEGRRRASRYFCHYELPKVKAWLHVVETRDLTCAAMPEEGF